MIRGTLEQLHLGDLLQWLKMGGMSGRLTLRGKGRERRIDFMEGRIVFVSSMVPSERLASFMAARGILPPEELRSCLTRSLFQRRPLTRILLEETPLEREDLLAVMESLATMIMTRLLLEPPTELTFDPGFPVRDLLGQDLSLDPNELLLDAARRTDEASDEHAPVTESELPTSGEAFDNFFWQLVGPAFTRENPVSGQELLTLRDLIHDVVDTLSQWATTTFGLVPVPEAHVATVEEALRSEEDLSTQGLPQVVWDRTVIASGIRIPGSGLTAFTAELANDVSLRHMGEELVRATHWHRPDIPRLDGLTSETAMVWSRRAAAAAPHLGAEPWEVVLGAHLLVVPTDLVLWVLASVHIPHVPLRNALLQELPRRLGSILAMRAALPASLQRLFHRDAPTPAGACLHMAHRTLPGAHIWLDPLAGDDEPLLDFASPGELAAAASAMEGAVGGDHTPAPGNGVG